MSQAFVRESDDQNLEDISPTVTALVKFLTRENGDIRVYEKKTTTDDIGREIHVMSNGMSYCKAGGKWEIIS
jgi:hypothetical protein